MKKIINWIKEKDKNFTKKIEELKLNQLRKEYQKSLEKKKEDNKKEKKPLFSKDFYIILIIIFSIFSSFMFYLDNKNKNEVEIVQKDYEKQMNIEDFYKDFSNWKLKLIKIGIFDYDNNHFQAVLLDEEKWLNKIKTINVFKLPNEKWDKYEKEILEMKDFIWLWIYSKWKIDYASWVWTILQIVFILFIIWLLTKSMNLWDTKNTIKKFDWEEWNKVTFDEIGWIESIKWEIVDTIETLKNWDNFQKRWVRLLRWILFYWPAWVWKTMIAKAIASELWVEMFIATWNDFRWMYLWQWAKKVHSTFDRIKKDMHDKFSKIRKEIWWKWNKLSILFIDEIDTVFKKRWTWHSEDDTVVNAFLHEIDWIEGSTNIIVIWATNHLDKLDEALLSRIDKKIAFKLPTRKERLDISQKIIEGFKKKDSLLKIKDNLSLDVFSANTYWLGWREIDNILNEVHRKAIVWKLEITESLIQSTFADYILGKDSSWIDVNEKDKKIVTYHELWHWVIWFLNWKKVHTITIIPKGPALGLTWSIDWEEKILRDEDYIIKEIQWLIAWRMAEKIWIWKISTGSSNDYERATQLAFSYFKDYNFKYKDFQLGYILNKNNNDNQLIDVEIHKILELKVKELLKEQEILVENKLIENKEKIDNLASILIEKEILEEEDLRKYLI